ncbi:hypothetical protein V5O48_014079 [Marasmius crinis-equi]|uniref:Uncharacterized protein n=1 Tax=Marasmius crinis-equi TaxID=585013 RepID=A0ABR3EYA8_9AGAR
MYFISPASTPIKYWINLLSVSTTFKFPRGREHAIAAIDLCQVTSNTIEPARIIEIANLYGVEKCLEPAYAAFAEQKEIVSKEEAEMIGMKGLLVIMRAQEARLRETIWVMESRDAKLEALRCKDLQQDADFDGDFEGRVQASTPTNHATPSLAALLAQVFVPLLPPTRTSETPQASLPPGEYNSSA